MSKRKVLSLVLLAVLVFLAVWGSTIRPEVWETIMEVLFGR